VFFFMLLERLSLDGILWINCLMGSIERHLRC
jgi:hypothetical protein